MLGNSAGEKMVDLKTACKALEGKFEEEKTHLGELLQECILHTPYYEDRTIKINAIDQKLTTLLIQDKTTKKGEFIQLV